MRRGLALAWLAVVCAAVIHAASALVGGVPVQTDLMALLPAEERDPALAEAKARVTRGLSQRVVLLVGHGDGAVARAAAARLRDRLVADGVLEAAGDLPPAETLKRLGGTYFPHRAGLLAEADRQALKAGRGGDLTDRALAQIYGIGGMADARLLAADPALLFPAFLTALPVPGSKLALIEGWPSVEEAGTTWVLVGGRMAGEALALADQDRFMDSYRRALAAAGDGVRVLRLGAVFFAHAGATTAIGESSTIGAVSILGAVALILGVFRAAGPLLLSLTAIAVGLVTALSGALLLFGTLHAAALMFGAALIGITVDYSLHYFCQVFAGSPDPRRRLAHVLPGLSLGLATTLAGYGALALAPLPGLRQVAVFSGIGLTASFVTVLLWFPALDRTRARPLPAILGKAAAALWELWRIPRLAGALVAVIALAAGLGSAVLTADDDVRRQQALDPVLVAEQAEIQRLIGIASSAQFYLVRAPDTETALVREEALAERLAALKTAGALGGWSSPAGFVPSAERQHDNARLIAERLDLTAFTAALGLTAAAASPPPAEPLRLGTVMATGCLPLLSALVLAEGVHVVAVDGAADLAALRAAAEGLDGIAFVDPTGDLTALLGAYRLRALVLLAASAVLMVPLLAWRYGWTGGLMVMAPPVAAVVATPPVLALAGLPFTFFGAMALVLVLSIGVDYAVFCAEDRRRRDPITILATLLATLTTLLSFGMLALSEAAGLRSFGAVMLVGIVLAFVLAPFAGRVEARSRIVY